LRWTLAFHRIRHPRQMGEVEIKAFLSHLATEEQVGTSTENQSLAALLFVSSSRDAPGRRNLRRIVGPVPFLKPQKPVRHCEEHLPCKPDVTGSNPVSRRPWIRRWRAGSGTLRGWR
jgi:hypothetical protein